MDRIKKVGITLCVMLFFMVGCTGPDLESEINALDDILASDTVHDVEDPGQDTGEFSSHEEAPEPHGLNLVEPDLEKWKAEGLVLRFSEYEDSIIWYAIPTDHLYHSDPFVTPKNWWADTIQIYNTPSLSATIIGEVGPLVDYAQSEWVLFEEKFADTENDQGIFGRYQVESDGQIWMPVDYFGENWGSGIQIKTGWVVLELVEVFIL